MAENAIINFSNAVLTDAEEKRRVYVENLNQKNKELLIEKKKELSDKYSAQLNAECQRYSEESSLEISRHRNDLKRELILRRREMFNDVFCAVRKNVEDYAKTDEYKERTLRLFKAATKEFADTKFCCKARKCDFELFSSAASGLDMELCEAESGFLGGFAISCEKKRIYLDYTLDTKIEEQKNLFLIKSGLVIE